jgi:predicted RNA-binding Zn-ribbon protein involved in translation (DUF1610 family)
MAERAPRRVVVRGETPPKPAKAETYVIDATCANCDWRGPTEVPKGTPVKVGDPLEQLATCPDCGCVTLVRITKPRKLEASPLSAPVPADFTSELARMVREAYRPQITTPIATPTVGPAWIGTYSNGPAYPTASPYTMTSGSHGMINPSIAD